MASQPPSSMMSCHLCTALLLLSGAAVPCPLPPYRYTRAAASRLVVSFAIPVFSPSSVLSLLLTRTGPGSGGCHSHYNSTPYAKSSTGAEQLLPLSLLPRTRPKNPRIQERQQQKQRGGLGEEEVVLEGKTSVWRPQSRTLAHPRCAVVFLFDHLLGAGSLGPWGGGGRLPC